MACECKRLMVVDHATACCYPTGLSRPDGEAIGVGLDSCVLPTRHKGMFLVQTTDLYPLPRDMVMYTCVCLWVCMYVCVYVLMCACMNMSVSQAYTCSSCASRGVCVCV